MARRTSKRDRTASATSSPAQRDATVLILAAATVVVPLIVSIRGLDVFRLPKELAFRATAILLMAAGVFAITRGEFAWDRLRAVRWETYLLALIIVWAGITTLVSTNRRLSCDSLITVICAAAIFLAIRLSAGRIPILMFDLVVAAACANAVVVTVQEFGLWNPFIFAEVVERHSRSSAFIGNPNDVGAYLVGPAVAVMVAAMIASGYRRWAYMAAGLLLAMGLIASGTRTALVAYIGGLIAFSLVRSWREAAVVFMCAATVLALVIAPQTGLGQRVRALGTAALQRRYDVLFSERLPAFLCAIEMFRAHPVTGVGPGCFKYNYMDSRIALRAKYPAEWTRGQPENFADVHNDHLQVLAESGLPGYGLFIACLLIVVGRTRLTGRHGPPIEKKPEFLRQALARNLRLPIVVVFGLLCLAQFPLELAAPRFAFLTLGGLCIGWIDPDEA